MSDKTKSRAILWPLALPIIALAALSSVHRASAQGLDEIDQMELPIDFGTMTESITTTAPDEGAIVIDMTEEGRFIPEEIVIDVGETIYWRNDGLIGHTITARPGATEIPEQSSIPDGAEPFDSGMVYNGEYFFRTFEQPGVYRYACLPHLRANMLGSIIVQPTSSGS